MSVAAEHALRTLADKLIDAADGMPAGKAMDVGREIMLAMGVAHRETADQLKAEREAREAQLLQSPGYKAAGGR